MSAILPRKIERLPVIPIFRNKYYTNKVLSEASLI